MSLESVSRWLRDRLFRRPPRHGGVHIDYKQRQLNERAEALTTSAKTLQYELGRISREARERGTDPLAELIRNMQHSKQMRERNG
jgi:hypothetical protein